MISLSTISITKITVYYLSFFLLYFEKWHPSYTPLAKAEGNVHHLPPPVDPTLGEFRNLPFSKISFMNGSFKK